MQPLVGWVSIGSKAFFVNPCMSTTALLFVWETRTAAAEFEWLVPKTGLLQRSLAVFFPGDSTAVFFSYGNAAVFVRGAGHSNSKAVCPQSRTAVLEEYTRRYSHWLAGYDLARGWVSPLRTAVPFWGKLLTPTYPL